MSNFVSIPYRQAKNEPKEIEDIEDVEDGFNPLQVG